jgi:hypothetical protein
VERQLHEVREVNVAVQVNVAAPRIQNRLDQVRDIVVINASAAIQVVRSILSACRNGSRKNINIAVIDDSRHRSGHPE